MADSKDTKLVGANYTTPDLLAKVTGKAKYAEDYRAPGMLFAKLLLSPMPHARVTRLDISAAMAMPGVKAILLPDDLPGGVVGAVLGEGVVSSAQPERALTMEPVYEGEPILAIAATSEQEAAEAIEKIQIDFEPLPFTVDPVASLRPGSPNARLQGNTWGAPTLPGSDTTGTRRSAGGGASGGCRGRRGSGRSSRTGSSRAGSSGRASSSAGGWCTSGRRTGGSQW